MSIHTSLLRGRQDQVRSHMHPCGHVDGASEDLVSVAGDGSHESASAIGIETSAACRATGQCDQGATGGRVGDECLIDEAALAQASLLLDIKPQGPVS